MTDASQLLTSLLPHSAYIATTTLKHTSSTARRAIELSSGSYITDLLDIRHAKDCLRMQSTMASSDQTNFSSPVADPGPDFSPPKRRQSAHAAADAARAMDHTNSWQPAPLSFTRRQSWSKEDQKRELQMGLIQDDVKTGPGFTERG